MSILWAAFLGLVQGVAEFLPISSSGHLSVIQNLFGGETAEGHMFLDVLLHLGTLVSVCLAYRRELSDIIRQTSAFFKGEPPGEGQQTQSEQRAGAKRGYPAVRLLLMIVIATLPLALVLPVHGLLEQLYYKTGFIGAILILTGVMLWASDHMEQGKKTDRSMTVKDALLIGLCQAIATIPGLSRSGTTISAGVTMGLRRDFAVKFSFLLSLPAVLGASIISLIKAVAEGIDPALIPAYLVGMLVAMVSGFIAINITKWLVSKKGFGYFAHYCWIAGLVTIILSIVLG